MRKTFFSYAVLCACLMLSTDTMAQESNSNAGTGNLKYVDPRIGNVGQLLQPTRPTAQLPNQVIRMYPDRTDYLDDQIASFPLNVVSHRLGQVFAVKPVTGKVQPQSWTRKLTYDHDLEITRPWYYSTYLIDEGITVEFAPAKKSAIFRFTFDSQKQEKSLLLSGYDGDVVNLGLLNGKILRGFETYHGNIKVYLYGEFNTVTRWYKDGGREAADSGSVKGTGIKAAISFPADTKSVELRYAVSYISAEQARLNFKQEVEGKSLEDLKTTGEQTWSKVINQIQVEGGTESQRRSFFSAFYRCNERMVDITENNQYYSGFDNRIHNTTRPFYVDDWTWDTYLALHPLRTILNPQLESDMANSYITMYQQSGWMPTFPVLFGDHACMNGFHSTVMLLDDYRKGIRGFDTEAAYNGMLKNATAATMLPWRNGPKTVLDDFYYEKGYFPALRPGERETVPQVHAFEKRQAVAVTLGGSYDDWALGEFARETGHNSEWKKFNDRSQNYRHLWNDSLKMFLPKDSKGNWIKIDPKFDGGPGGREYYDENNGWTYMWQVQHDIKGLIGLMGGKAAFENRLDQLFREPLGRSKQDFWYKFPDATGLVGEYSIGNEPSFHIPYLYNFTNAPWKTQKRIRFLLDVWFKDNIFGIPGDEDGGGMSAFVVFSSMGFYPITPGLPVYTIGSPVFSKVTIDLPGGKQFKLTAHNCSEVNKYIQSAKMNGEVLNKPSFTHEQLMAGGELDLEMGPKPNKAWGVDNGDSKN